VVTEKGSTQTATSTTSSGGNQTSSSNSNKRLASPQAAKQQQQKGRKLLQASGPCDANIKVKLLSTLSVSASVIVLDFVVRNIHYSQKQLPAANAGRMR
jgi:hypothetical protein